MTLDAALILAGIVLSAALLALLLWKRVFRVLPVFTAYAAYSLCSMIANFMLVGNSHDYLLLWGVWIAIDALFYLAVLVELGKSVLRYNGASPLPSALMFVLFAAGSLPIWVLTRWHSPLRLTLAWQLNFRAMQATAILEVAGILTLVWLTALQDLRWPERELRLVMGMAAWPMVQLCALVLHERGFVGASYHWLDLLTPISAVGVSIYWVHYFLFDPTPGPVAVAVNPDKRPKASMNPAERNGAG